KAKIDFISSYSVFVPTYTSTISNRRINNMNITKDTITLGEITTNINFLNSNETNSLSFAYKSKYDKDFNILNSLNNNTYFNISGDKLILDDNNNDLFNTRFNVSTSEGVAEK